MPLLETRASASAQGYGLFGATASTGNFFLISQSLPSAVSTVTFSSIPATYKHLQVRFNLVASGAINYLELQANGDSSTSDYAFHRLNGSGSAANASGIASGSYGYLVLLNGGTVATYPAVGIIDVIDYANTNKNKTIKSLSGTNNNTSAGVIELSSGLWLSTSAVTSLTLAINSGTFTGTISLYGVS